MRRLPPVALATLAFLLASPASAQVAGGGKKDSDCLTEFQAAANHPTKKPKQIRCVDNDPTCDVDPTEGVCQFAVDVCLNVDDAGLPSCAAAELDEYVVENVHPDTDPRHDFEFQTLEDQVGQFGIPVTENEANVCAGAVAMVLRLPVKIKKNGGKYRKAKKTLRTTVSGPDAEDVDKLPMSCQPNKGFDPCTGIASTFQQIQEHILTPHCGRDTCHNSGQSEHTLSLAPGDSHTFLVGVRPDNAGADALGKLRVDPGNPKNSYLLDKLKGKLQPNEGERMPRQQKKLKGSQIRLIEDWIEAGAPENGFVASLGCGAGN